jgi:anti-anti-sigma regulatory factor
MTLKIQRATEGAVVVFTLSGRIEGEQVEQLQGLLASEAGDLRLALDLQDVDLVNRETVRYLARCAADGIQLRHCPAYIREWMVQEAAGT